MKVAVVLLVCVLATSCSSRTDKQTPSIPTIENLNAFAARLPAALKSQMEGSLTNSPFSREYSAELVSTDIRKTDSLIHPIVGVVVLRHVDTTKSRGSNYMDTEIHLLTATFAFGERWEVVDATDKVTDHVTIDSEGMSTGGSAGEHNVQKWSVLLNAVDAAQK